MHTMKAKEVVISIVGAFVGTLLASFFSSTILAAEEMPMILASTGASAMLIFGLPHSHVSQPWNLVGGHLVSALVGVSCHQLIPIDLLAASLAIPIAMLFMFLLRCLHPPGGATAITAVIGGSSVDALGYSFVVVPVFFNAIILLSIAMAAGGFRENNPFTTQNDDEEDS
jgi:CBS domain-containing membrane protein